MTEDGEEFENRIEIDAESVDRSLESLEAAMSKLEVYMENDEVRPSVIMTAKCVQTAYKELVEAHPEYELQE